MAGALRLSWLDVFTDRPLGGNPLAVVYDADTLTTTQMQRMAREFGLSETVFVLENARRLRIFTPGIELPMAGHPVVGAAIELARTGQIPSEGRHVFQTGIGDTPVEVSRGRATMTQGDPVIGPEFDAGELAWLAGLEAADVIHPVQVVSTGVRFAFLQVRDRPTLARAVGDQAGIADLSDPALGLVVWCEAGEGRLAQRMFAPRMGIREDPATGSAAGALCALQVARGSPPGRFTVSQGAELSRPSTIDVEVGGAPARPADVRVSGTAVLILEALLTADLPR